jgi:hypothetical protein
MQSAIIATVAGSQSPKATLRIRFRVCVVSVHTSCSFVIAPSGGAGSNISDILVITANIFAIGMLHALYSKLPAVVVMLLGFSPRESIGILIDDRNAERTISSVIESI